MPAADRRPGLGDGGPPPDSAQTVYQKSLEVKIIKEDFSISHEET